MKEEKSAPSASCGRGGSVVHFPAPPAFGILKAIQSPMEQKSRATCIILVIAVIVGGLWFVLRQRSALKPTEKAPRAETTPAFTPPVYGKYGTEAFVALPLYFEKVSKSGLTAEQQQKIADFKAHILARAASKIPLNASEKFIISGSISTDTKQTAGSGVTIVDQRLLQFTDVELGLIRRALQQP